jgi:hypothetical protein
MPGVLMAAARHNRPTIIVYGGTIQVGTRHVDCPSMGYEKGGTVNISDAFESYGGWLSGFKYPQALNWCQVPMLLASSTMRSDLMLLDIHVPALVPVVVCIRTCFVAFKQKPPHMT